MRACVILNAARMHCAVGNDIRKVVLDGWPVENVIASDLNPGKVKTPERLI